MIPALFPRATSSGEDQDRITIVLGSSQMVCSRGRLAKHLELGMLVGEYLKGIEEKDAKIITEKIISYLAVALSKSYSEIKVLISPLSFQEVTNVFLSLWDLNQLRTYLPFMRKHKNQSVEDPPWYYEGREVLFWIHTIAFSYHWSREEILNLVPEEAMGYLQEIMVSEQLAREWEYGLSEVSRTYDTATKQSRFVPLKRPSWMVNEQIRQVKLLKKFLPVGKVIEINETTNVPQTK